MPPLLRGHMTAAQQTAADELAAGPRKGVKGPFIPLLRSPELLARLQKVGEFLRFQSSLPTRISEFATLVVSRQWTQQFEWQVHVPLALQAGTSRSTIDSLAQGGRPQGMSDDEALVFDFVTELVTHRGVNDATYRSAVARFEEAGVLELVSLVGYFTLISMVLNVAHTPAETGSAEPSLTPLPR